jgi:hypothetical protein
MKLTMKTSSVRAKIDIISKLDNIFLIPTYCVQSSLFPELAPIETTGKFQPRFQSD